ncbi:MAG: ATP-binding protein [Paracoccus sp. (in: a-proteobacteria)]|nr:ATP-binding protein [Paracoccus sp. (in: a-proteobacteria)]
MKKLLRRLPGHVGLWVPLLALPLLVGEIMLHASAFHANPGATLSLMAAVTVFGWYFLGGGLALAHLRDGIRRRRQLARLRPVLEAAPRAEWAVDGDGLVLAQSARALDQWGDFTGRPLAQLLGGRIADAAGESARLCARARRHGKADLSLPGGAGIHADQAGSHILHIRLMDEAPAPAPAPEPMDYDRLPIAVLRLGADGTVLQANRAAQPYCGGQVEKTHISKLLDGLGRPFDDWLAEALKAGQPLPPEVLRAPRAGQDRFIQVSLHAEGGDTLIAVLSDARALKTLEAQFVQSQKMQAVGQLAGGIAHDFNNLLTAISGHCDLLMLRHDKGDPDYADLDQISQNANRAANLVSHLLAFSRKQTLKPQQLDLRDTLADLSHLLNRLVGEKITLDFRHDPRLDPVRADRSKIEQVIMNLVVNARDAMPFGGRIDISTQNAELAKPQLHGRFAVPPGRYVRVSVADQGAGIAPDVLGKIFEPFFTTKRVGEGTGLGLSTAYGIVKQTGGYILCDSTLGEGTVFTIYLPVHSGAETPVEDAPPRAPAVTLGARPDQHVLLVEDEAPVRAFASRALKLRGYQVIEAASGEEALALLTDDRLQIDLFVSDVVMPGLDGVSWVRHALKDRPRTRVIFMSGYTEDVFEDGRNPIDGASFLQKPFSLSDLIAAVGEKLDCAA